MKLSIVIPTRKRATLLKQSLTSIITSKVPAFEVIIGDDGGDIETIKVCESFSKQLPINYLEPKGKGSLASNIARLIRHAKGEWILLLHDDDFLVGDHSLYPAVFSDKCDFFFTDHFIANEDGEINELKTLRNSKSYGRAMLKEGMQQNHFDLAFSGRVCLDGFYIKREVIKELPIESFGYVADYFWVFNILNSGIKIWYSPKKTFAYRISTLGLTAQGLNIDLVKGYRYLLNNSKNPVHSKEYKKKIAKSTWHSVNTYINRGERKKAWELLKQINFIYYKSIKRTLLIPIQILRLITSKNNCL